MLEHWGAHSFCFALTPVDVTAKVSKGMQLAHFCLPNFNGFSKFLLYFPALFRTFQMLTQHPKQKLFSKS